MTLDSFEKYEIDRLPDWMLMQNIRSAEHVLGNPDRFPKADVQGLEARYAYMVGEAAGRLLPVWK